MTSCWSVISRVLRPLSCHICPDQSDLHHPVNAVLQMLNVWPGATHLFFFLVSFILRQSGYDLCCPCSGSSRILNGKRGVAGGKWASGGEGVELRRRRSVSSK